MLSPAETEVAMDLALRAVEVKPEERAAFLDRACVGRPHLAPEALRFVQSLDLVKKTGRVNEGGLEGRLVDHYRIGRVLGKGGSGVVHEARDTRSGRVVALKVMHPDLAGGAAAARFHDEHRTLAKFSHPGIPVLYEPLSVATGMGEVPAFAMELVRGRTLGEHARAERPDLRARLTLMRDIALAVAHAHSVGVIHRDLKPENLLIDGHGRPKVLDFGVARQTGPLGHAATTVTATNAAVGTIKYMSPEQARGERDVGPASDVYSLGVIMYELLSGRPPYEIGSSALHLAAGIIGNVRVPPLGSIRNDLRGDVSKIVHKALEKDPGNRYADAGAMADDVERHLRGAPIAARTPTLWYRAVRLASRYRVAASALALPAAALTIGSLGGIVSLWAIAIGLGFGLAATLVAWNRASRAARAQAAAAAAENEVLRQRWDIFDAANFWLAKLDLVKLQRLASLPGVPFDAARAVDEALLRPGLAAVDAAHADNAEVYAAMLNAAATLYRNVRMHERAIGLLNLALDIRLRQRADDHPDVAAVRANLGYTYLKWSKPFEAEPYLVDAVQAIRARVGAEPIWLEDLAGSMNSLAEVWARTDRLPAALDLYEQAAAIQLERALENGVDYGRALTGLGRCLARMGEFARAEESLRVAAEILERQLNPDSEPVVWVRCGLAEALTGLGRLDDADHQLVLVSLVPDDPYATPEMAHEVCWMGVLLWEKRVGAGEANAVEALEEWRRRLAGCGERLTGEASEKKWEER